MFCFVLFLYHNFFKSAVINSFGTLSSTVGCPPGKYLAGRNCRDCAKGYYQENEYQINCTQCPAGQSTRENGSKSLNDCQGDISILHIMCIST